MVVAQSVFVFAHKRPSAQQKAAGMFVSSLAVAAKTCIMSLLPPVRSPAWEFIPGAELTLIRSQVCAPLNVSCSCAHF